MDAALFLIAACTFVALVAYHIGYTQGRDGLEDVAWDRDRAEGYAAAYYRRLHPDVDGGVRVIWPRKLGSGAGEGPTREGGCQRTPYATSTPWALAGTAGPVHTSPAPTDPFLFGPRPGWLDEDPIWDFVGGPPVLGSTEHVDLVEQMRLVDAG